MKIRIFFIFKVQFCIIFTVVRLLKILLSNCYMRFIWYSHWSCFNVSKLKFYHIVWCLTIKINSLIKLTVKWPTRYSEILVRINHNKMETNRCKIIGLHKHLLAKYCKIKESKSYNSWINNSSPTRVVYLKQMNVHMYICTSG